MEKLKKLLNWFMQTLLDRSERMASYNGFEIRVPFCDYRLAQYVWNIPWEIKALKGREKGLLRYICKDFLPDEIVDRKKSPYPKTHNPEYLKIVSDMLEDRINNNGFLSEMLDMDNYIKIKNGVAGMVLQKQNVAVLFFSTKAINFGMVSQAGITVFKKPCKLSAS